MIEENTSQEFGFKKNQMKEKSLLEEITKWVNE